jgi:chromosome segregation ATPase
MADASGFEQARRQVQEAESELQDARERLSHQEAVIREKTGRVDASLAPIREAIPKLEEQRQTLKLEVVGKQARQEALAKTIDRLAKSAEERTRSDPVAEELDKVVKLRIVALERMRKLRENAAVSEAEVAAAEVPIAEARAKLLERREAVAQASGGELLAALNRELSMISIDVAEAEAKLDSIEKLLKQFGSVQGELSDAEQARREWARASDRAEKAQYKWREVRQSIPPAAIEAVRTDTMAPDDPRLKEEKEADAEAHSPAKP